MATYVWHRDQLVTNTVYQIDESKSCCFIGIVFLFKKPRKKLKRVGLETELFMLFFFVTLNQPTCKILRLHE